METVRAHRRVGNTMVRVIEGDLTAQAVDAIVNAANSHLQHGGGVAGAIVRKGGRQIQEESDRIGLTPVGQAALTTAGRLKARFVIHAVGPRWGEGDEDSKLESAVRSALSLAEEHTLRTIALPAISSGIFGFPRDRCARIMIQTVLAYLEARPESSLERVDVCLLGGPIVRDFEEALAQSGDEGPASDEGPA